MTRDTVIFDFGGVITSSPFEAFNRLEDERGLPRDIIRRINALERDGNAWARFERAEIDAATFDAMFAAEARALGHDLRGEDVLAVLAGDIRPAWSPRSIGSRQKATGSAASPTTCRPAAARGWRGRRKKPRRSRRSSRGSIMSSKARRSVSASPTRRSIAWPAMRSASRPTQCVYLDDLGINCKPAAELGMAAIKVTSGEQALADLEKALGLAAGTL